MSKRTTRARLCEGAFPCGLRASRISLVVFILVLPCPVNAAEEPTAVTAGRRALEGQHDLPWYDPDSDSIRPVGVRPPAEDPDRQSAWRSTQTQPNSATSRSRRSSLLATILEFAVWGLLGLLLLGVLGALIWWFLRAESSKIEPRDSASEDPIAESDRLDQLPIAVEKSNRNLLETARMWEKAGDLGQAIVYLFAYMLVELDRHQLVRLTRGKTNRQYLAELERSFSGGVRTVAALQEQSKSVARRYWGSPRR